MTTIAYDTAEAESLFAFAKGRVGTQYDVRKGEAVTALQRQLGELARGEGCTAEIDPNGTLFLRARGQTVAVQNVEGEVRVHILTRGRNDEVRPELDFDPRSNLFVGRNFDDFHVPEPGKPRKRRSALAVVAEMVAGLLYGAEKEGT